MWNGVLQEKVVAEASVVTKVLPTTGSGVMQKYTHIEVDSSKFNTPKEYPGFVFTIRDAEMFSTLAHINETCWASGSNFMKSSVLVEYMRDIDDWPTWVSAYADTVTNTIRTTGHQTISQSRFTGTALILEPFIVVRWYWLIYPAVILLLPFASRFGSFMRQQPLMFRPGKTIRCLSCMQILMRTRERLVETRALSCMIGSCLTFQGVTELGS